jgi:hypothetical protein
VRLTSTSEVCIYQTWYARLDIPKVTIDTTIETNAILDPKNITRKISKSNKEEWEIEETDARGRKAERRKNSTEHNLHGGKKSPGPFRSPQKLQGNKG